MTRNCCDYFVLCTKIKSFCCTQETNIRLYANLTSIDFIVNKLTEKRREYCSPCCLFGSGGGSSEGWGGFDSVHLNSIVNSIVFIWRWIEGFCTGEGNGNPLQCSCLENPRGGGAWWAAIYGGFAQIRARLNRLSISSSSSREILQPTQV